MKKAIPVIVCLFGLGLPAAQVQANSGAAEAPASASVAKDYPNLHAPELTAADIAQLLDLKIVKGRLIDIGGVRIGSYQLLFRDHKGKVRTLHNSPMPYSYRENLHRKGNSEMLLALAKGKKKNEMEVTLIVSSDSGSVQTTHPIRLAKNIEVLCRHEFKGKTGATTEDWNNVVPIGDSEVFTFDRAGASEGELPAAVILRVYPEPAEQTAKTAP